MLLRSRVQHLRLLLGLFTLVLVCAAAGVVPVLAQDAEPGSAPAVGGKLYLPAVASDSATAAKAGDVIPNQYIVVLKDPVVRAAAGSTATEAALASEMAAAYGGQVLYVYDAALSGFAIRMPAEAAVMLAADANVDYIEQDRVVTIPPDSVAEVSDAALASDGDLAASATEAVTQTNAVWGLDRIDQRLLPLNTRYVYSTTTAGVHAYIIDTGIWITHTEFTGRIGNGFSAVTGGVIDCNGHGTHVAGTVGGTKYGVAKQVTLHPVRVLDCDGSGSNSGVIAGINWVTANHVKPAVANMSLGGPPSFALRTAVERSIGAGVVHVVAAGNDGTNACLYAPANVPAAITVGATDNTDTRADFSNWGSCVDLFAPGVAIKSAWIISNTATNTIDGTSMASPHVAGVVALYLKGQPTATPAQVTQWLLNAATPGLVANAGIGSPNRLLYNGLPEPAPVACTNKVTNPGFESDTTGWTRSSTNSLQLICSQTGCGGGAPTPHTGSYLGWLGRFADDETSTLTNGASMALSAGVPARLSFWYAIDSDDSCNYDYAYVRVTAAGITSTLKTFTLCNPNTSGTWQRQQIDLRAFAGKTITLAFEVVNDSSAGSSFYVDDVRVVSGASCSLLAAAGEGADAAEAPEMGRGEDIVPSTAPKTATGGQ